MFRSSFERRVFTLGVAYSAVVATFALLIAGTTFTGLDSVTHGYIPATIVRNGVHSKFANIGTVWLPLYHLLLAPLVLIKPLYSTGLAGTIVNALATGGILVYLTRIVTYTTDRRDILYGAIVLFLASGMTAIYSVTPMTEQLYIFLTLGGIYHFSIYWSQGDISQFVLTSVFMFFATFTRYEAWFIAAAFVVAMLGKELRAGRRHNVAFFHLPLWGGFLWMVWNIAIFEDPVYFVTSTSMPISLAYGVPMSTRLLFLGALLTVGGGTVLLPVFLEEDRRCLAIAPAAVFLLYVITYWSYSIGGVSSLRYGYSLFAILIPGVVVLDRIEKRKATLVFGALVLSVILSSGLILGGIYGGFLEAPQFQSHPEQPGSIVLLPIGFEGHDMDSYPTTYLDPFDGKEWIEASKAPWKSKAEYVIIPPCPKDKWDDYRDSGPNEGMVWNFYTNETWKEEFLRHFELVNPKKGLYKQIGDNNEQEFYHSDLARW